MHIGIVAPPFIAVPPAAYGGTELFIADLAAELHARGHRVIVYANGESRLPCELKWRYPVADWPIRDPLAAQLKNADHSAWAVRDAAGEVDILHLNDVVAVPFTRFVDVPALLTVHHPHEPALSAMYAQYPHVEYVAISAAQARREPMPSLHVVHHGLSIDQYTFGERKDGYLAFLGRMAPCKGAHRAIAIARRAGVPLKLAGEIQPPFVDYWEREVRPHVDGRFIEYLGEADRTLKNELLSRAQALLFPIDWDEPFGLVMIEAMACGTPVLAFPRGSVPEIVRHGVSGWLCRTAEEMAARAADPAIAPCSCRAWAVEHFSRGRMAEEYVALYARAQAGALSRAEFENVSL
jgi:glycosyltransferase involved in cell wall biosynthesis